MSIQKVKEQQMKKNKRNRIEQVNMVRQGDVLIMRIAEFPELGAEITDSRGVVLAEGETSGHHHQVFGNGSKLFAFKGATTSRGLLVGDGGAEVRVVGGEVKGTPRHIPVVLPGGKYEVRIQQTWSLARAASERVAD